MCGLRYAPCFAFRVRGRSRRIFGSLVPHLYLSIFYRVRANSPMFNFRPMQMYSVEIQVVAFCETRLCDKRFQTNSAMSSYHSSGPLLYSHPAVSSLLSPTDTPDSRLNSLRSAFNQGSSRGRRGAQNFASSSCTAVCLLLWTLGKKHVELRQTVRPLHNRILPILTEASLLSDSEEQFGQRMCR